MGEIERATSALQSIPCPPDYDSWFKLLCAAKSANVPKAEVISWCEFGDGFKPNEFESKWKSIDENIGIKEGSLFHAAFENGWKDQSESRDKSSRLSLPLAKPSPSPTKPIKQAVNSKAADIWARCIPATPAEQYIDRKRGKPEGVRVYPASAEPLIIRGQNVTGYLAVPCWSGNDLQTLQFIPPDGGDKLNLPGASFNDGFFTVGEIIDRVYICEGIGQAWAVNQATGKAAVVCFGAGRMMTVAKVLRDKFPSHGLVIVPDRGKEEQAEKIAAAVAGQWVEMPADKPSNYDANDFAQELGTGALSDLLQRTEAPAMRFKLLSGADLCNAPPMRWMVRGVLPVEGLAALFGASGSGKSFLMLDIGCAVAGGDYEWFGRRVTQCPVTYVCLEGEAGIGKRVKAWSLHHNKPAPDALRFITQPFDLLSDDVPELAKAVIAGGAGGLVILDTLNRAAPGADENSSVDMGNLIAAAKQLQTLTGGLVLLVHHTGKDTTKGLRGHSSLYAALDGAIEVTATDTRKAWSVAKSKDDVTGDAHPFKLDIVPAGTDDEGEEITSCVIVPDDSAEAIKQAKRPSLRSNQKIANEALGEALRKSPHNGKEGAPVGRPCIQYTDAVAIVAERIPADAKHKTSRAKIAITGLVERGFLAMKGDWLWDK
ncbi:MAG: AAA family ATPase [Gallionella sp.]